MASSAPSTAIGRASSVSASFLGSTSASLPADGAATTPTTPTAAGGRGGGAPGSPSRRHRKKGWDSRIHYPSMTNNDRHATFRRYFTPDRPDVNGQKPPKLHELPKDPKLRDMVVHRRDFYINSRYVSLSLCHDRT
jgi:hypothetical protein